MTVGLISARVGKRSAGWKPLRVGAGGFIRGMDLAILDNTMVGRTDTFGAWIWNSALAAPNGTTGMWEQLCSPDRFPVGDIASLIPNGQESFTANGGVWEITIAPNATSIIYMGYLGNIYKSIDKGKSWSLTPGWSRLTANEMPTNNGLAQSGPKMAVDPINSLRVFFGTGNAAAGVARYTLDGGTTFNVISTAQIAAATANSTMYNVAFDPRVSTQSGGISQVIYFFSGGNGLYKSIDGGTNWTLQNSVGMPTTCLDLKVNPSNGDVWVVSNNGTLNSVYKYSGTTWTHVTAATSTGVPFASIAIDPNTPLNMILFQQGSFPTYLSVSSDGGTTWNTNSSITLVSNDIPWLSIDHGLNVGRAFYDNTGKIIASDGVGFWTTTQPPTTGAFSITSQSAGVEQLITNQIISPPGGYPVVASWDRAGFTIINPNQYPNTYYPGTKGSANEIVAGWGVDYATSDPTFICIYADAQKPFYSTNKGITWQDMVSTPPVRTGGAIAASTPLNMVVITSNNGTVYYTTDGGNTWNSLETYFNTTYSIPLISSGNTGWGNAYYDNRQYICADRVAPNTFYLYNDGGGVRGLKIFKSSNGGSTWSLQSSTPGFVGFYGSLKSVPQLGSSTDTTGHLFFTAGSQGGTHPASQPLYRSTDGGVTWPNANTLIQEAIAVGFGKNDQSTLYPAVGFYGWYNGVGGFWVSKDNCSTFTKFGDLSLYGTSDIVSTLTGDANVADTWYVGLHNSGSAYYGI
jgi:hypothetical protein